MLSDLLDAKLVCMPSVCYIPNINCKTVYLYLVLNRIGVAAIFVTSVCRLLSLSG